jgi:hypothetical protein
MKKFVTAALLSASAFAAVPALAEPVTLVRDGATYQYTVAEKGDARIIAGKRQDGEKFRLVVRRGWVSGQVGGREVSFRVKEATPAAPGQAVETAAR